MSQIKKTLVARPFSPIWFSVGSYELNNIVRDLATKKIPVERTTVPGTNISYQFFPDSGEVCLHLGGDTALEMASVNSSEEFTALCEAQGILVPPAFYSSMPRTRVLERDSRILVPIRFTYSKGVCALRIREMLRDAIGNPYLSTYSSKGSPCLKVRSTGVKIPEGEWWSLIRPINIPPERAGDFNFQRDSGYAIF